MERSKASGERRGGSRPAGKASDGRYARAAADDRDDSSGRCLSLPPRSLDLLLKMAPTAPPAYRTKPLRIACVQFDPKVRLVAADGARPSVARADRCNRLARAQLGQVDANIRRVEELLKEYVLHWASLGQDLVGAFIQVAVEVA